MALNANEVRVAITGEVYAAPVDTAAPTTAVSELDAAFVGLGYNSEDGVVESFEESSEVVRAWQNNAAVRTITTEPDAVVAFTMLQTDKAWSELVHKGSDIDWGGEDGYRLDVNRPAPDPRSFVLDVIDGDERVRIHIPCGEVVERGDVGY